MKFKKPEINHDDAIYCQGDYTCDLCNGKIDFVLKWKRKPEKSLKEWKEYYADKTCGFLASHLPQSWGVIYYHGHCFWDKK